MRTKRLELRPVRESDWPAIQRIWLDFSQSEYVWYDTEKDTADDAVRARIAHWAACAGPDHFFHAVCLEDAVIGYISLNRIDRGYELGYGFQKRYHGFGYARESLRAILEEQKASGTERICAGTALKNMPSVRLLESLGFSLAGREYRSFHTGPDGNPVWFEGGLFEKIL